MKKSRLVLVATVYVAIGFCSVVFNTGQASATAIGNANLTNLSDAQKYVKANRSGYQTYIKDTTNTVLYHPNAGTAWNITAVPTNVLTKNNDGSADEKDACVDIGPNDDNYDFKTSIWANRGGGCGTNGTTSSGYSGGQVNVNPPNDFPIFLFIEDVDGLNDRQHIAFTSTAIQYLYTPSSDPSFSVSGGDDLVSNGNHVTCTGEANCNAIVLLRANSFNIKAGSKDGDSVMRVRNNTSLPYVTLTLNPNGGSVVDNQVQTDGTIGDESTLWSHTSGANVLREYEGGTTANEYPTPTKSGNTFLGWYDAGGNRITSLPINSDITLTARWNAIPPPSTWTMTGYTSVFPSIAAPGQQATFTHHVVNNGPDNTSSTGQVIWSDTQVSGGVGVAKAGHNNGAFSAGQDTATDTDTITIPNNVPVGTQYCQRVGYQWSAYNNSAYGSGAWACVLVASAPYTAVVGGDVWAGGSTDPATSYAGIANINGTASAGFGSFGEYGVFATGTVDYFGSAGQLGQAKNTTGTIVSPTLTFGSAAVPLGNFTSAHKITNLSSYYSTLTTTAGTLNAVSHIVTGGGVYADTGVGASVTLWGIAGRSKAIIYVPNGTVRIEKDIVYDTSGSPTSFKDLPSLTIIAKNIVITSAVSEIAGNFYASGRFVTCDEGPWSLADNALKSGAIASGGACSTRRLTINGAVTIASQTANPPSLVLNRSFGGSGTSQAAEIIRMRPEVFLTPYENNSNLLTTIQETELPARY